MEDLEKEIGGELRDREKITPHNRFRLAKTILLFSIVTYFAIASLYVFSDQLELSGPIKQVWTFSSQAILGIINLLIGFYFGDKAAKQ